MSEWIGSQKINSFSEIQSYSVYESHAKGNMMRRKRWYIWGVSILILMIAISLIMVHGGVSIAPQTSANVVLFWDGAVFGQIGYSGFPLMDCSYKQDTIGLEVWVKQTAVDKNGGLLIPSPIMINNQKTMMEQCGVYDITINCNGDVTTLKDLKYSGERNVAVARGIGWALYITRDKWTQLP